MIIFCRGCVYFVFFQCFMLILSCNKNTSVNEPIVHDPLQVSNDLQYITLPPNRPERVPFPLPSGTQVDMVAVFAGGFWMGEDWAETEERPRRLIGLDGYFIDQYEVTVAHYRQCVEAGVCEPPAVGEDCNWQVGGRSDHPVNCVSWYDANRCCEWAGKRLPTEAEWEKAARGTDGRRYPWGNAAPDCDHAITGWGSLGCGAQGTWPVGSVPNGMSPYGAHDMIGNVWEWVVDTYEVDTYRWMSLHNPVHMTSGDYRVLRGNSWYYSWPQMVSRASNRYRFKPDRWYPYIGFRCVKSNRILPTDNRIVQPTTGLPDNWIARNAEARTRNGELPFDTMVREPEMILIPAGTFIRGSENGDGDEIPIRTIYQDAFYIDKYEVTVGRVLLLESVAHLRSFWDHPIHMKQIFAMAGVRIETTTRLIVCGGGRPINIANGQASVCQRRPSGKKPLVAPMDGVFLGEKNKPIVIEPLLMMGVMGVGEKARGLWDLFLQGQAPMG